jgi:hypothetical protein
MNIHTALSYHDVQSYSRLVPLTVVVYRESLFGQQEVGSTSAAMNWANASRLLIGSISECESGVLLDANLEAPH